MELVWLVVAVVALVHLGIGYRRAAARSFAPLGVGIGIQLTAALACHLIGESKTGGYLSGIVGFAAMLLLLIAAGALVLGGSARFALGLAGGAPCVARPLAPWDMLVLGGFAATGIILSALE